jgi:hypothetical protein
MKSLVAVGIAIGLPIWATIAYSQQPSDPVYWCNLSRAQISNERDSALAQVETLKQRISALEAKATEMAPKKEPPQ